MNENPQAGLCDGENFDHGSRSGDDARHQPIIHCAAFVVVDDSVARSNDIFYRIVMMAPMESAAVGAGAITGCGSSTVAGAANGTAWVGTIWVGTV